MKILKVQPEGDILHWCPGCDQPHRINTADGNRPRWDLKGPEEMPTITPSVNISWPNPEAPGEVVRRCHYHIEDGYIRFVDDTTHSLSGHRMLLPEFPPEKIQWYQP